ncbi:hypothetical protein CHUAL_009812 [Chamberlinius hualienensis]
MMIPEINVRITTGDAAPAILSKAFRLPLQLVPHFHRLSRSLGYFRGRSRRTRSLSVNFLSSVLGRLSKET